MSDDRAWKRIAKLLGAENRALRDELAEARRGQAELVARLHAVRAERDALAATLNKGSSA